MLVGGGEGGILLKVKATLSSAEVSAGTVAKANQNFGGDDQNVHLLEQS